MHWKDVYNTINEIVSMTASSAIALLLGSTSLKQLRLPGPRIALTQRDSWIHTFHLLT